MDAKDEDGRGLEYEGAGWKRPCGIGWLLGSGCNVAGSSFQFLLEAVSQNLYTKICCFLCRLCFLHLFVYKQDISF